MLNFIKKHIGLDCTPTNLGLVNALFVCSLIISNIVTMKLMPTGVSLFGQEVVLPGAAICYAITFLVTDVVGEIWGKAEAKKTVWYGIFAQVCATLIIYLTGLLPAADPAVGEMYQKVFGTTWVFVLGSLGCQLTSQTWDVWFFHKVRDWALKKNIGTKHRWIWNNLSTMTSQIIDTVVFIGIAFGLGFGWLFNEAMWPTFFGMLIGQYVFKWILAVIDTPFFYLLTAKTHAGLQNKEA